MSYTYAKVSDQQMREPTTKKPFIFYPLKCVFCDNTENIDRSYDGWKTQTCGQCKKTFYAPDYYELKNNTLVRKA